MTRGTRPRLRARRRVVSVLVIASALSMAACTDSTAGDGETATTTAADLDPALTLTVPDPPGDLVLAVLADAGAFEGEYDTYVTFDEMLTEDAGAVLVATTEPDMVDFARRVVVCAKPAANAPDRLDWIDGESVDLGHSTAVITDEYYFGLPTCGETSRPSMLWHENGWILTATAMDGDLDNAEYIAGNVHISDSGAFETTTLDGPWVVSGQLDYGWSIPPNNAIHRFESSTHDDTTDLPVTDFATRIVTLTRDQRHAFLGRLAQGPDGMVDHISGIPAYDTTRWAEPTSFDLDGQRVVVGAWGSSTVAGVVVPEDDAAPSVAVLAAAHTTNRSRFPEPRQLAELTAAVRAVDDERRQELIDASVAAADPPSTTYEHYFDEIDPAEPLPVRFNAPDHTFWAWPWVEATRLWNVEKETSEFVRVLRLDAAWAYPSVDVSKSFPNRTLDLDEQWVDFLSVDVPEKTADTFAHPTRWLPPVPSGRIEFVALAAPDIEVEVVVDGTAWRMPLFDITHVATNRPPTRWTTLPYEGRARWGRMVLDAPNGRDSITVRGVRDGEAVFERSANPFG